MTPKIHAAAGTQKPTKTGLPPRLIAIRLVTRVVDDRRNLDALCDANGGLDEFLSLDQRDRGLARAIATTTLRHLVPINEVLHRMVDRKLPAKAKFLLHTLQTAIAQILYMNIPDSAAVNLAVDAIAGDQRTSRFKALANAVLRRLVREKTDQLELVKNRSLLPPWFSKQIRRDFGKENLAKISAMIAHEPSLDISVKEQHEHWAQQLGGRLLETNSIRMRTKVPVRSLPGFAEGAWWVQDTAATFPVLLLGPVAGKSVLDLCAAPGGKTAQLISAGADVTALDISKPRLERLADNLRRLSMNAEIVQSDILEWENSELYDAVLLDAPCSSSGTIRQHPDVMWTRSAEEVQTLAKLQFDLVMKARTFVKPGGTLVFSNCSMFKQEGEDNLAKLLEHAKDLEFSPIGSGEFSTLDQMINGQGAIRTLPYHLPSTPPETGGLDGFFACRFIKR